MGIIQITVFRKEVIKIISMGCTTASFREATVKQAKWVNFKKQVNKKSKFLIDCLKINIILPELVFFKKQSDIIIPVKKLFKLLGIFTISLTIPCFMLVSAV